MSNTGVTRDYFKRFFSGKARYSDVRELLADDFHSRDPLMSADSAEEYVNQVKAFGDVREMHVERGRAAGRPGGGFRRGIPGWRSCAS
jgi:hypothetical protein